jgi:hypothetical protein
VFFFIIPFQYGINNKNILLISGTQERSEVIVESVKALPDPFGSMTSTLIDVCAYAGTGNVLKTQVISKNSAPKQNPKI